jgi:hypothetical protein
VLDLLVVRRSGLLGFLDLRRQRAVVVDDGGLLEDL